MITRVVCGLLCLIVIAGGALSIPLLLFVNWFALLITTACYVVVALFLGAVAAVGWESAIED